MERIFDPTFSDNSFGFRTNRSAHDAMKRAKAYYEEGYRYVVDLDLKSYFDTVNHDKLMYCVEQKIKDKKILRLIRKFLRSGKSFLKLQKEFQGWSYDLLISNTTIVFTQLILLVWQNRCSSDEPTLGGMFYELCDEMNWIGLLP